VKVAVVIVAAGQSQRFGSAKMHHLLGDGRSLLDHTIDIFQDLILQLIVVVPRGDLALKRVVEVRGGEAVDCVNPRAGLSESIKAGINNVLDADACLIALGDMPYVSASTIQAMLNAASQNHIVLPSMKNAAGESKFGNPVIFGKSFFKKLLELEGDAGGKSIVNAHLNSVRLVAVDDPGIFVDVDRPTDLLSN
jgi:molybdenum cofactor cytidylyltransferase